MVKQISTNLCLNLFQRAKENSLKTEGKWENSLMEGEMRVETLCGGWVEGYWSKGVPHGFQREFGPSDIKRNKKMLKFVGRYYRGQSDPQRRT